MSLSGFRKTLDYLYDGEAQTTFYLLNVHQTYKRWPEVFNWLVVNDIRGKKLVEMFQNESDKKMGVMVAVTYIINKIDNTNRALNASDLQ